MYWVKIIILIQIIKWKSPYTYLILYCQLFDYFLYFFIENECLYDMKWNFKREKKGSANSGFKPGLIASKAHVLLSTQLALIFIKSLL